MDWQPPIDVAALSKGLYSQGAEEGMLDRVFELVAPRRRFCVEFGAGDGVRNSNTADGIGFWPCWRTLSRA